MGFKLTNSEKNEYASDLAQVTAEIAGQSQGHSAHR